MGPRTSKIACKCVCKPVRVSVHVCGVCIGEMWRLVGSLSSEAFGGVYVCLWEKGAHRVFVFTWMEGSSLHVDPKDPLTDPIKLGSESPFCFTPCPQA